MGKEAVGVLAAKFSLDIEGLRVIFSVPLVICPGEGESPLF